MNRKPPAPTPRPVRDLVPDTLAELLRDQPMSQARLEFAWRTAAGQALARISSIELAGHSLRVEVPGPLWGAEIQRASPELLERLARLLGPGAVTSLEVRWAGGERPTRRPAAGQAGQRKPTKRQP